MPRVSAERLEATRTRILDAARRCFIRNGFHVTSMQDIQGEAGLSAGAVYRHFKSKDELICAIAMAALAEVTDGLSHIFEAPEPPPLDEVVARMLRGRPPMDARRQSAVLMVQVWGEVARRPELQVRFMEAHVAWRAFLVRLITVYQHSGQLGPDVPPEQLAHTLVALLQGFNLQLALASDIDVSTLQAGVRGLLAGPAGAGGD
jgi:TetR/AcrR family transcriptional regulator, transcriptional repressor of aconitase